MVIICANGSSFSAGIDLSEYGDSTVCLDGDVARHSFRIRNQIMKMQTAISAMETCHVPIIVAIHGACVGAALDLATAADIRYCASDSYFSIREAKLGLAADLGTLQRLPRVVLMNAFFFF